MSLILGARGPASSGNAQAAAGYQSSSPFPLPSPCAVPVPVEVPGCFVASGDKLLPLAGDGAVVPSPADSGITASVGDDTTAPNATTAGRLNRVVCAAVANVGYSDAKKDTSIPPCALSYDAEVIEGTNGYSMSLRITLEYASSFPNEGMVVWIKKKQQFINEEKVSELMLIDTSFEDWADSRWVPINTDIRYAEEAEAVVQAVITSDSGQTAGRIKTTGAIEDAKLGPVGERGRICLTYFCEELYSYAEMDLGAELHRRSLVPLAFQLPWAPFDSPAASCQVQVHIRGPEGSKTLSPAQNILAYRDLLASMDASDAQMHASDAQIYGGLAVVLPEEVDGKLKLDRNSLPPKPTAVLAWLSIPEVDDGWEHVGSALPPSSKVTLLQPCTQDAPLLCAALPGGQTGQLIRCRVDTEAAQRSADVVRVHTDFVISDASGSTGMRVGAGGVETVRACFNKHEERRVLKRLEAIPHLESSGLLLPHDVWRIVFVVFDHGVHSEFALESCINDLDGDTVSKLLEALVGEPASAQLAAAALNQQGKGGLLNTWRGFLTKLRHLTPGGTTSFVAGAERATRLYAESTKRSDPFDGRTVERTAYVNFDTDGGNNCGPCYKAIKRFVAECDVVQGHVLGVGSWVDQDCASKVAKILKGATNLAVNFPTEASADVFFRQDLSRWIKVLRSQPISLTVSAGPSSWQARQGARYENAAECIFARAEGVHFGAPDVSQLEYTKACLHGLQAGESAMLYILSRLPVPELQRQLAVELGSQRASVVIGPELLQGVTLGHHWISLLGGNASGAVPVVCNHAGLCSRLKNRLEDDLSFAWNLPTRSGSTAALGRSKTEHRLPVVQQQQPDEPTIREAPKTSMVLGRKLGPSGYAAPPAASVDLLDLGDSPKKSMAAALFCGLGPARAAAPPPAAAPPAASVDLLCADFAAPPASAPAALPTATGCAMPRSIRWEAYSASKGCGSRQGNRGHLFGSSDEREAKGPEVPTAILRSSRVFGLGPSDVSSPSDLSRAIRALKYSIAQVNSALSSPASALEDPLVSQLLGATPSVQGVVHHGFVCDHCQMQPIVGPRFKATNKTDIDVCLACRTMGKFAGGSGFVLIPDQETPIRGGLQAVLDWWPLVSRQYGYGLVFQQGFRPQLSSLSLAQLKQAVAKIPDV